MESGWSHVESIFVNVTDEDGDGLPDSWEQNYFGNLDQGPSEDYDGDGYSNLEEYQAGSDPTKSQTIPTDIDGDGLPDIWEQNHFGNLNQGAGDDYDGDDFSNLEEYQAGSNPVDPKITPEDMDGDGLPDSWEQDYFGNLDQGPDDDYDGDDFTNYEEYIAGTDPTIAPSVKDEDESFLSQYWWLFVIFAVVIVILVILFFMRKRPSKIRKPEGAGDKVPVEFGEEPQAQWEEDKGEEDFEEVVLKPKKKVK
jgi:hypothetical protein